MKSHLEMKVWKKASGKGKSQKETTKSPFRTPAVVQNKN
jgi:hypothetical protein